MRVVIIGAGGHGQVVADILLKRAGQTGESLPLGFVDDDPPLALRRILGLPVFGNIQMLVALEYDAVVVAIGSNAAATAVYRIGRTW